ncbi:MAG: hypothetical protein V4726_02355 [Verrucomicrobiota bacterium]
MIEEILSRIFVTEWLVLVLVSLLLLALAEAGFRFGIRARRKNPEAATGHSGSVQGAVLGLLGLLLGFSFAMAVGRNDTRRSLAVEEANSIGTTWLRTDFLPGNHPAEVRNILRQYTALRLQSADLDRQGDDFKRNAEEAAKLQSALWKHATAAAEEKPSPVTVSFITSLNETLDLQSSRLAARFNHVPSAVWLLLLIVAGCGAWASGYGSGAGGHRSTFSQIIFPVLIAVVITIISDMDRPHMGLIGVSQQPLRDLLESMEK